jgi:hypothetical protein
MRALLLSLGLTAAALSACDSDRTAAPSLPESPETPDLTGQAFRLSIDTRTGQVDVAAPAASRVSTGANRPSFSLIGQEAAEIRADAVACVPIPANLKLKRCSFLLEVENQLAATDFITPTSFPRPPQGVSGILLFPWSTTIAGATGVAVPSPDWDRGPADFFNDYHVCSAGVKSDCYRSEIVPSPLYAGQSSGGHRVGYDVPAATTTISAYVVVAADLRDNPVRTTRLNASPDISGMIGQNDEGIAVFPNGAFNQLEVGSSLLLSGGYVRLRTFLSFRNFLPRGARIVAADLRVYSESFGAPVVDLLDYGTTLDDTDYDLTGTTDLLQMLLSNQDEHKHAPASIFREVQKAVDLGAERFQFRLRAPGDESYNVRLAGLVGIHPPDLILRYTLP